LEHFVEVGKRREGETARLHSPAQWPLECSDAAKHSEEVERGYVAAVRKMASAALDGEDKRGRG